MSELKEKVLSNLNEEGYIPFDVIWANLSSKSNATQKKYLERAFFLGLEQHRGQIRKENNVVLGESFPYIYHTTSVGCMLSELGFGWEAVSAGLLHDSIENGGNFSDISSKIETFGEVVNGIVNTCSKPDFRLESIDKDPISKEQEKEEFLITAFILSLSFPEALAVLSTDRLHNFFSLGVHKLPARRRITRQTIDFYLPVIETYDTRLHQELDFFVQQFSGDPELLLELQEFDRYVQLEKKISDYAIERRRHDLLNFVELNGDMVDDRIRDVLELCLETMTGLYESNRTFDAPNYPYLFNPIEWANMASDRLFMIVRQMGIRTFVDFYFSDKNHDFSDEPNSIQYGFNHKPIEEVRRSLLGIDSVDAVSYVGMYTTNCEEEMPYIRLESSKGFYQAVNGVKDKLIVGDPALVYDKSFNGDHGVRAIYDVSRLTSGLVLANQDFPDHPFLVVDIVYKE